MVSSTNFNHNELTRRRILRSREQIASDERIRQLRVSKLNINANSYIDLIDWTDKTISEPSFTYSVTTNEIKEMIDSKPFSEFKIPELSCHTQNVKRHIKLVTEASSLVCDRRCHALTLSLSIRHSNKHFWIIEGWAVGLE